MSAPLAGPETMVATATGCCASMLLAISDSSGKVAASMRSTKTSSTPPQVSPTANASSSLTPYRCRVAGAPEDLLTELIDSTLDAATGDAADGFTVDRHRHGSARRARR